MNGKITVVKAGQGDIPLVRAIADSVWPRVYRGLLSPEQISYMMDMMYSSEVISKELSCGVEWYLLNCGNETAGYLSIYFFDDVCKLDKIYIKEEFRRSGIGRTGIEFVKDAARKRGVKQLILNVNKYNKSAHAAYFRYGFTHLRDEVNDIGNGFVMDDFVLALDI